MTHQPRTWFITGASSGLGHAFATAALAAGDRVAAASRTIDTAEFPADGTPADGTARPAAATDSGENDRLLRLPLDVTDRAAVFAAVAEARRVFGRLDVIVNNAGTLSYGFLEEFDEAEARAGLETNLFGALWVSQAAAGALREQRGGHLLQVSSIGGVIGNAMTGVYSAGKFALEGFSESLAAELGPFGAHVTIVEPGGYWTPLYERMHLTTPRPEYAELRAELETAMAENSLDSAPSLAADAVLELVASPEPPLRLLLGNAIFDVAVERMRARIDTWTSWERTARAAEQATPAPASAPATASAPAAASAPPSAPSSGS